MIRKAFTLIELILTIVIVGIVSLSFPLIMMQTSNNVELATQQEAILATKTYMGTILSRPWDENSLDSSGMAVILETDSAVAGIAADSEFNRVVGTNMRSGNIDGYGRRRLINSIAADPYPTADGTANWGKNANLRDVDDFDGFVQDLTIVPADMDYMFSLKLTPTIRYVGDGGGVGGVDYTQNIINFNFPIADAGGITNIKMVAINVVNTNPVVDITIRAYSTNIGEFELLKRSAGEW
ncbi:MAG: type II secretion system GspH family protein [Campylobacteraceae bacterium]|jgi:prepilin-type N-terminal cleavage/methylation domain-containing protein|nr:type II secretion system GspH family protein [Campylobacteraceae bacterium]